MRSRAGDACAQALDWLRRAAGPSALVEPVEGRFAARVFAAAAYGLVDVRGRIVGRLDAADPEASAARLGATLCVPLRAVATDAPCPAGPCVVVELGDLRALLAADVVVRMPPPRRPVHTLSLAYGVARLEPAELRALAPSDELHLPARRALVFDDGRHVELEARGARHHLRGAIMMDPELATDDTLVPVDTVPLPLVVEAVRLALSADELARLAPGDELPVGPLPHAVVLRVAGSAIARGVVRLEGERLVVRVTEVAGRTEGADSAG